MMFSSVTFHVMFMAFMVMVCMWANVHRERDEDDPAATAVPDRERGDRSIKVKEKELISEPQLAVATPDSVFADRSEEDKRVSTASGSSQEISPTVPRMD